MTWSGGSRHSTIPIFFQAEDGIRDLVRSRGLGDVYKRQEYVKFWKLCQLLLTFWMLLDAE